MFDGILNTLGGLGVFLIGMHIMTTGLKRLAGDKLRQLLARFTNNNISGVLTGAFTTAVIQSSSATTITAVGFVNAGLMRFTQALAIVIGANIGTTVTGWLVAALGFKLKLLIIVQPLIFFGAFLLLFFKNQLSFAGKALAGFGLIFVGLSMMQSGMSGMTEVITPDSFPSDNFTGRILLVLLGIIITLITQSSSAGVAMAVTALNTGTINLFQAAAMIIGMDIGTTFTAYLATIGASIQAKRTGYAHVIYNILTGVMAFLILVPFFTLYNYISPDLIKNEAEMVLVSFHTSFNAIGVLLILPFMKQFSEFLVRLVPEPTNKLTSNLEKNIKDEPSLALSALNTSLRKISEKSVTVFIEKLSDINNNQTTLSDVEISISKCRDYLAAINLNNHKGLYPQNLSAVHIIDHLERLKNRLEEAKTINLIKSKAEFTSTRNHLLTTLPSAFSNTESSFSDSTEPKLNELWKYMELTNKDYRKKTFTKCIEKDLKPEDAMALQDAMRWIERNMYHLWRISFYLSEFRNSQNLSMNETVTAQ